ncbi:matrixin family metalloprotease [Cellulomonas algicola]|uniref:matrixin family metalloprotease n=1 Tax=Cellulomonas algicola TaxID=2071633 RepID=UPI001C3F8530|nr:matrixin family metalloprotease [Cellulomonas algicola]
MPRWLLDERAARARQAGPRATTLDGSTSLLPSQPGAPAVESITEPRTPAAVEPGTQVAAGSGTPAGAVPAPAVGRAARPDDRRTRRRAGSPVPSTLALGVVLGLAATTFGPGLLHDAQRVLAPVVHGSPWLDAAVGGLVRAPVVPPAGLEESGDPIGQPPSLAQVSRSYAYLQTQADGRTPVAWSPCRPVHYVVRPDGEPPGGRAVIDEAAARLSRATGLVIVADGETDEQPSEDRAPYQPDRYGDRWAPVLVSWSDESEDARLAGGVAGVAGPVALEADGRPSVAVSGSVSLDAAQLGAMLEEPDGHAMARAVAMHELAHVVGLGHVDDPTQLMAPSTDPSVTDFQAGDLTGLALLGSGPCAPWL